MLQPSDYKKLFNSHGIKFTKQRNLIFDLLNHLNTPLTAEEFFLKLNASVDLSTVYRILDMLVEKELVIKTYLGSNNKARFELNRMEHKHRIVCIGCNRTETIESCPLDEFEKEIKSKTDFDVTGHKLEIYGFCKMCKLAKK